MFRFLICFMAVTFAASFATAAVNVQVGGVGVTAVDPCPPSVYLPVERIPPIPASAYVHQLPYQPRGWYYRPRPVQVLIGVRAFKQSVRVIVGH